MPLTNKQLEQIEKFLDGQMTEEEASAFQNELKANEELRRAFELEKKLHKGISRSAILDLKNKVTDIDKKLENEQFFTDTKEKGTSRTMKYITAVAAVLILVFAVTYLIRLDGGEVTPEELFAQYYQIDQEAMQERAAELRNLEFAVEDSGRKDSLSTAIQQIEQGEYEDARDLLNELISRYPGDKEAFYYAGLNQLQLGNYANAISKLQIARSAEDKTIQDNARYYFALCALMLKDGDQDNIARREFQRIADDETSEYQEVARNILSDLDSQ